MDRVSELRSRQRAGRPLLGDRGPVDPLQPVPERDLRADPEQARRRADRRGGRLLRHRQGLRPRWRRVRHPHAKRSWPRWPPGRRERSRSPISSSFAEIDPIYFDKPYFLAPHGKNGDRAYELLRKVMEETNKVAIATFVMREKQYLVAVRPEKNALVLETLLFADEVRDPVEEIDVLPVTGELRGPRDRHGQAAHRLDDDGLGARALPRHLPGAGRGADRPKAPGHRRAQPSTRAEPAPVVDLLAALQASVTAAKGARGRLERGLEGRAGAARSQGRGDRAAAGRRARDAATRAAEPGRKPAAASRSELLRQAGELNVAGRSKMSREELEQAVAEASRPRRRKAS